MLDRAEAVVMGDGYVGFDDGEESYVNRNEYDMRVFTDEDAARDFAPDTRTRRPNYVHCS